MTPEMLKLILLAERRNRLQVKLELILFLAREVTDEEA